MAGVGVLLLLAPLPVLELPAVRESPQGEAGVGELPRDKAERVVVGFPQERAVEEGVVVPVFPFQEARVAVGVGVVPRGPAEGEGPGVGR